VLAVSCRPISVVARDGSCSSVAQRVSVRNARRDKMHLARTQTNGSPCLLSVLSQFLHRSNSSSQGMLLVGVVMSISIPFIRAACEVIRGDGWRYCCVFQVHVPTLLRKQVTAKSIFKTVFVSSRNMTTMRKFWTIALLLHRLYEKCYAIIRRVSFSKPLGSVSSLARCHHAWWIKLPIKVISRVPFSFLHVMNGLDHLVAPR